jgi:hypothetical protein
MERRKIEERKKRKQEKSRKERKKKRGIMSISPSCPCDSKEKLFCQTFLENDFSFTKKSAPPAQPQPEQPQPQLYQMHP